MEQSRVMAPKQTENRSFLCWEGFAEACFEAGKCLCARIVSESFESARATCDSTVKHKCHPFPFPSPRTPGRHANLWRSVELPRPVPGVSEKKSMVWPGNYTTESGRSVKSRLNYGAVGIPSYDRTTARVSQPYLYTVFRSAFQTRGDTVVRR